MNGERVLVIAEAGVNHNGSLTLAKELVDSASEAGADIIKFQAFHTDLLVDKMAPKANYQILSTGSNQSQLEMLRKLELGYESHLDLLEYCGKRQIQFLSSPFDLPSLEMILDLGLNLIKVPSGEITNLPLLEKIAESSSDVILSTGMAYLNEISQALEVLQSGLPLEKITVLHCNTEYPTPFEDVNLLAMLSIKNEFNVGVGYSDHTTGIEVPIAATALGAAVIEKHLTLNRNLPGPDHKSSLQPSELGNMIKAIRNIEMALGDSKKRPSPSELPNREIVRKSIFINRPLSKGHILDSNDLVMKRPGTGISPMNLGSVIGKRLNKDMADGEILNLVDLE